MSHKGMEHCRKGQASEWQPTVGTHSAARGQVPKDTIPVRLAETERLLSQIRARLSSHDEKLEQLAADQQRLERIELKMGELQRELEAVKRRKLTR